MAPLSRSTRNAVVAVGCVGVGLFFFAVPAYFSVITPNLTNQKEGLGRNQMRRGMYVPQGRDLGMDPNWDPVKREYNKNTRILPDLSQVHKAADKPSDEGK